MPATKIENYDPSQYVSYEHDGSRLSKAQANGEAVVSQLVNISGFIVPGRDGGDATDLAGNPVGKQIIHIRTGYVFPFVTQNVPAGQNPDTGRADVYTEPFGFVDEATAHKVAAVVKPRIEAEGGRMDMGNSGVGQAPLKAHELFVYAGTGRPAPQYTINFVSAAGISFSKDAAELAIEFVGGINWDSVLQKMVENNVQALNNLIDELRYS